MIIGIVNDVTSFVVILAGVPLGPNVPSDGGQQIHAEGGRYLGRALRSNDYLFSLNLRLNRLMCEGGRTLLEGLRDNASVTRLNLSGNRLGSESVSASCLGHPTLPSPSSTLALTP